MTSDFELPGAGGLTDLGPTELGMPENPVTHRAMASGAISLLVGEAFQFFLRLGIAIVLARLLTPADFGLVGLVTVVTGLLERTVSDGGMVNALVHRDDVSRELASSVFFFNLLSGVLLFAGIFLAAGPLAHLMGNSRATDVFRGLALVFAIASFTHVPEAMLRRSFKYAAMALLVMTNAFVTGLVAIPLAIAGHGVASLVIGAIAGISAEMILALALSRWTPVLHFRLKEVRSLASFSGNLTAFHFLNYFSDQGDKFIVGRFVGTSALGFYAVPYRLVFSPISSLGGVFSSLFFPVFAREQHDHESIGNQYIRAAAVLAAIAFPFCGLISALGGPIVDALLGPQWHAAGPIVTVMSAVALIQSVLITVGVLYTSTGRTNIMLRWGAGAGAVMFACYATGVYWGAMGVACGFLLGTVLLAYPAVAIPFGLISCSPAALARQLAPVVVATVAGVAAALGVRAGLESLTVAPLAIAVAGGLAGIVVYLPVLLLQKPPVMEDVRLFIATRRKSAA
ncbi:MAG TPA: lipopolysaccharide biosynthesis protein [Acidimicrobiia bacterium]|jgi:PST family polysaccharide transporter|nr:lipopolysaccharide biosynthesis protein [Acidimicrobiia bacterium]